MTQHVRRRYGNHRRGVWAAAVVLAVLSAAAVVPLATGAPPKHYTLTATPDTVCFTGAGQTQTFELTLTNQSTNTSLGSANITAPSFITLTAVTGAPSGSSFDGSTIMLRNLNLSGRGGAITLGVDATITAPGTGAWASVAKQSNDFADAPGPGNLLSLQGDPPPLTVTETCGGGGDEFVECNANDEGCTDGTTTLLSTIPLLVSFESPDTATCGGTTLTFISQQTFIPDPDDGAFVVTFTYDASISPKQVGATRFCVSKDDGATFQQLLGCEGDQTRLPCVLDRGKIKGALYYQVSFPAGDPKVGMG